VTELAKSLHRDGFETHIACFHPDGVRAGELRAAGIPIVGLQVRAFHHPSTLLAAARLARYLRRNDIQIVHSFDVPTNLFGTVVSRTCGAPLVLSSQRSYRHLFAHRRNLLRLTDRLVDGVVVNCKALERHLVEEERVPPQRVFLCHNGVDLEEFHAEQRCRVPGLENAGLVIGTACVLRPEKDLATLLKAFKAIQAGHAGLRLLIVGSGPVLPELENLARQLGIANHVVFQPATRRVADWLRSMDVFGLPSVSEGFSNSLMEAMACGCAAVASRVGGNPELVKEGSTGFLFGAGKTAELACVLQRLVVHADLRKQTAAAGTEFVRRNFSTTASGRRMGEIYRALLRDGSEKSRVLAQVERA
jgi:glycosyltransferase involved in cell wall biosynthesis